MGVQIDYVYMGHGATLRRPRGPSSTTTARHKLLGWETRILGFRLNFWGKVTNFRPNLVTFLLKRQHNVCFYCIFVSKLFSQKLMC